MSIPIKFHAETSRVKSLSFHLTRPWLLVGLASGAIQIWDYRLESMVHSFSDGSNSPIRCVQWHPTQPIFAAAGDDESVRVFNYQTNTCLFILTGHNDYIRSLQFHHEQPWLITASDDQTAKIWNWQSRQCICTLLGHHYYVMDAKFHPFLPLIATASLDNTVRIWNYSQLLLKQNGGGLVPPPAGVRNSSSTLDGVLPDVDIVGVIQEQTYISVLSWYYHQPTAQTYLFFGGKESSIQVHTLNESNFTTHHHETLRINGHSNAITSLTISQQSDSGELLSTSEDGSAKIWAPIVSNKSLTWNQNNTTPVQRPDGAKAWAGAIDNKAGRLYAVGHETGFCLFKISRERYGYGIVLDSNNVNSENGRVFWMSGKKLVTGDMYCASANQLTPLSDSPPTSLTSLSLSDQAGGPKDQSIIYSTKSGSPLGNAPQYVRSFYINPHNPQKNLSQLLYTKGGSYTIHSVSHPAGAAVTGQGQGNVGPQGSQIKDSFTGSAKWAVFASNTRIALLSKENDLVLISHQNEIKRKLSGSQIAGIIKQYIDGVTNVGGQSGQNESPDNLKPYVPQALFPAPSGYVLLRVAEYIVMFDINTMKVVSEFLLPARLTVKRVLWNADFTSAAFCTKTLLYLIACNTTSPTKQLSLLATHVDSSRIKSLCFDNSLGFGDVVLFNTATHLKFLMPNGHLGILKTLNDICYLSTLTLVPAHVLKQQEAERKEQESGQSIQKGKKGPKKPQDAVVHPTPYDRNIHYFTRQGKYCVMRVNCIEFIFKKALHQRETRVVADIMFSGLLHGNSIINYVCDMGYYDLALHLSTDAEEKFRLSLQCGNLKDAIDCAIQLNAPKFWTELAHFALQCGNTIACEQAYINTQNLYLLSFLYILTGQNDKLERIRSMCLSSPPPPADSHHHNHNQRDRSLATHGFEQHNTYELGIWLSFFLGKREDAISKLFLHLTQDSGQNGKNGQNSDIFSKNNLFNKPTLLMLLKFASEAPALSESYSPANNTNTANNNNEQLVGRIVEELKGVTAQYKQSDEYETEALLYASNPQNYQNPVFRTIFETATNREVDCVASYPLSAQYLNSVLEVACGQAQQNEQNEQNQVLFENLNPFGGDESLEDELVDLLLQAPNLTYSNLAQFDSGRIKLPAPTHFDLQTDQNDQNDQNGQQNDSTGLVSVWDYLSRQSGSHPSPQILQQATSPWPLISLQQLQQQQQQAHLIANPTLAKKQAQTATIAHSDDDWFQDILSHAQGLAGGAGGTHGANSLGAQKDQNSQQNDQNNNQETWDLDLDDIDDPVTSSNNDDFMDFDNAVEGGASASAAQGDSILAKCGQFLMAQTESLSPQQRWLSDVSDPSQQTFSTARQFFAGDFVNGFYTLQTQVAPTLTVGSQSSQSQLLTTLSKNIHLSSFLVPSIFPSLSQLDTTTHSPTTAETGSVSFDLQSQKSIPFQFTLTLNSSAIATPTPTKIPLPLNPITVTTIKDRYQLVLQYVNNGKNDQALIVARQLLEFLGLSTALPVSYNNNTDLRFMYNIPYFTRELILMIMCEEARNNATDNSRKAIYGLISTLVAFPSFPTQQELQSDGSNTGIVINYQQLYDITINTYWLACKYLFQLQQPSTVVLLCRKILSLGQQYHQQYQSNKVPYDTVKKLLKKCEGEVAANPNTQPITFPSPVTKQHERVDYNALVQLQQQTQQVGTVSFVSQFKPIVGENLHEHKNHSAGAFLPKGINIALCSRSMVPITTPQLLQTSVVLCSFCHACAYNNFEKQQCRVCKVGTYGGITATGQNGLQYQ